jgi:hypothetical protein
MTLKDGKGGIISVHVDEDLEVKNLRVGPVDEPLVEKFQSRFTVGYRHEDASGVHVPGRTGRKPRPGSTRSKPSIAVGAASIDSGE